MRDDQNAPDAVEDHDNALEQKPVAFVVESKVPGTPGTQSSYQGTTVDPVSRPYITREIRLQSHQSQRIFKRSFDFLDNKLYQMSIVLRILTSDAGASAIEAIVEKEFTTLTEEMALQIERLEQLSREKGLDNIEVHFSRVALIKANVSSPRAGAFLNTLVQLDRLMMGIAILWLGGLIDSRQHTTGSYQWQRRVMYTVNRVQNVCSRSLSAAREMARRNGGTVKIAMARDRGELEEINTAALDFLKDRDPDAATRATESAKETEAMTAEEIERERRLNRSFDDVLGALEAQTDPQP